MVKTPIQSHSQIPFASRVWEMPQRLCELEIDAYSASKAVDLLLDVPAIISVTLRGVSKLSPVPYLSNAAWIALDITEVVQEAGQNRNVFKILARDCCELVYVITCGHKDISRAENIPEDLVENLRRLVQTLTSIHQFAQKCTSRNVVKAILYSGMDANRIRNYREMLRQSMRVFGLRSDISLRYIVAGLAYRQIVMIPRTTNCVPSKPEDSRTFFPMPSYGPPSEGPLQITTNTITPIGTSNDVLGATTGGVWA